MVQAELPLFWSYAWQEAVGREASDIHVSQGEHVFLRVDGVLQPLEGRIVSQEEAEQLMSAIMPLWQRELFQQDKAVDFSWHYQGRRLRINVFSQMGGISLAMRILAARIPTLDELHLPKVLRRLEQLSGGLLLVCGSTGAGKTTTLAAMLSEMNKCRPVHIITLEDPVEYIYGKGCGLVSQRELGRDFFSFSAALRSALRQDPDVILIGELRDRETVRTALHAAQTGHFVLATLHTRAAHEAVLRLESMFSAEQQAQVRMELSVSLEAIISQELLPAADGGRVCAMEILLANTAARNLIRTGRVQQLRTVIMAGRDSGMQTMERAVSRLAGAGLIDRETAVRYL